MAKHKMKRRTKIILASVITLSVVGGVAFKFLHGDPEAHAARFISHVEKELSLDANQVQALTDLKTELFTVGNDIRASRNENANAVLKLLAQSELDQQQALALVTTKTHTINERAPQLIAALADFTDSLTPVQRQELLDRANNKMERWNKYRH